MTARILYIGLDSGDPELLFEWGNSGAMPVMGELLATGSWARLKNLPGFGSGAMWPSIATGVSPASHGRYFARQIRKNTYTCTTYRKDEIVGKPFWAQISEAGGKVGIIDFPYAP